MDPRILWLACKTGACLIPLKQRRLLEISGPDRGPFLQGLFSQDVVKNFPTGAVTYGIFPNVKGRILADAYVWHIDPNRFLLDVESFAVPQLMKHLETYLILLKAEIKEVTGYSRFSLLGSEKEKGGANCCKALEDKTGFAAWVERPNFKETQLWVASKKETEYVNSLKNHGTVIGNDGIYDCVQIEAGIPKLGREMDETTFPQEVGLVDSLNFKKGCFVGAEVLQRIFYQGHVNRAFALFATDDPLPRGASIMQDGIAVGTITTSTHSFERDGLVALGLIKISALELMGPGPVNKTGEPLTVPLDGKKVPLQLLKRFP